MEDNNQNNNIISPMKKKSKSKLWFWILGIVLVLALGYIGYEKYNGWKYDQDNTLYQEGAYLGYNQAIMQIVEQVNTCQSIPINYLNATGQNKTINVLKIECLSDNQLECLLK